MNLVYADKKGNLYDHPRWTAVGRNGDIVTEILEDELIPLPAGATLVSLPNTHPIAIDKKTGEMKRLSGDYQAVGALLPQGYTRLLLPGYVKTDRAYKLPLFGYTAVVWKDGKFYVAAQRSDEPDKWNPENFPLQEIEL